MMGEEYMGDFMMGEEYMGEEYSLRCHEFSKKLVLTSIICPGLYLYLKQHIVGWVGKKL